MKRFVLASLTALLCAAATSSAQVEIQLDEDAPLTRESDSPPKPVETKLLRAKSAKIDLRTLPRTKPKEQERAELEGPEPHPIELPGGPQPSAPTSVPGPTAAAPP